jgi:hypothetical protein
MKASKLRVRSNSGVGKLTLIVFGAIVFVVAYCAYNVAPFYYYYFELNDHMRQIIKVASMENDEELKKRLMDHIKMMEIPMHPEDLIIERDETAHEMHVSLKYKETFWITFRGKDYKIRDFPFYAHAEGKF